MKVWKSKAALLQPLVNDNEAAVVPIQNLHSVPALRNENEKVAGEEVFLPLVADDGAKAVDAVPHVDGFGCEKNPHCAGQAQHHPSAANSSAR